MQHPGIQLIAFGWTVSYFILCNSEAPRELSRELSGSMSLEAMRSPVLALIKSTHKLTPTMRQYTFKRAAQAFLQVWAQ